MRQQTAIHTWIRLGSFLLGLALAGALAQLILLRGPGGRLLWRSAGEGRLWVIGLGILGAALGLLCLWALIRPEAAARRLASSLPGVLPEAFWLRAALTAALLALPSALLLGPWGTVLSPFAFRALLFLVLTLIAAQAWPASAPFHQRVALAALISAGGYTIVRQLVLVTDYAFALGWSEGNRLWDYSLYFLRDSYRVVGDFSYPTYMAPGRHALWGLPFLIPGIGVEWLRLWDAILWTVPYVLLGLALFSSRRVALSQPIRWGLVLWAFLFVSQGPIYVPLVLSAIVLFWFYRRERMGWTLVAAALACFYAGISRWTWLAAPAIWAGIWALLEEPPERSLFARLRRPVLLGLGGLVGAAGSQLFLALAFPRPDPVFSTAFSQPLLWYRLLPNPTNPFGILPGLLFAVGPALLVLTWLAARRWLAWDALQLLGIGAALLAFTGVGLVASLKIGGGNNLHNMDMLLISVVFLMALAIYELQPKGKLLWSGLPLAPQVLLILAVLWPAVWTFRSGGPIRLPSRESEVEALQTIQEMVAAQPESSEVLFMDQRQLYAFAELGDVPLVMEYELKDVMNQAMGGNEPFFEQFYQDLRERRFRLIISDPVKVQYQGRSRSFGEENDAWVRFVSVPLLEYYEPLVKLDEVGVWILAPKEDPG